MSADPQCAKKTVKSSMSFCAFGTYAHKSCVYNDRENDTSSQFHQHFMSNLCANILMQKN